MLKWWAALASRYPAFHVRPIVRKITLATIIYGSCLSVAVTFPDKSAEVRTYHMHACFIITNAEHNTPVMQDHQPSRVLSRLQVIAVTGAVGCTLISYFIPIINHFFLFFGYAQCNVEARTATYSTSPDYCGESQSLLLIDELLDGKEQDVSGHDSFSDIPRRTAETYPSFKREGWSAKNVLLPTLVLCGGVLCGISVLANFDVI